MGKTDCTHKHHLFISTKHHFGFIKGVRGECFVLINKWHCPQSAFTHNTGPTIFRKLSDRPKQFRLWRLWTLINVQHSPYFLPTDFGCRAIKTNLIEDTAITYQCPLVSKRGSTKPIFYSYILYFVYLIAWGRLCEGLWDYLGLPGQERQKASDPQALWSWQPSHPRGKIGLQVCWFTLDYRVFS